MSGRNEHLALLPAAGTLRCTRGGALTLALALFAALLLASASPADAVTQKQAQKRALKALGSKQGTDAVIVFGLSKPLRPGSRITQATPSNQSGFSMKVGRERAFFFYEDGAPYAAYQHAGRVALVGAKSGKVRISKTITWAPLVNGKLPAFLKSLKHYSSPVYQVYSKKAAPPPPPPPPPPPGEDPFPTLVSLSGNHHPKSYPQTVRVKQDSPRGVTLAGADDEDDFLTFEVTDPPDFGTLSGQPPHLVYTPNPGFLGTDKFAFKSNDGESDSNTAHVTLDVLPLGQPPVVTTSSGCTAYVEQTPAVVVDGGAGVADPDDAVLASARVSIASNFQGGDDLLFTDQNGITGSYSDNTGVLTLDGEASLASYQAALRSVRYRNLSNGNPSPTKDIEFVVNDAGSDSAPATKTVCITEGAGGANNKPIGETSEGGLAYTENDGAVPLDGGFFIVDPDSAILSGATVRFTESQPPEDDEGNPIGTPVNNFVPAEDGFGFTDQNGISGSYDDVNGILTLSGDATVEEYEAAIRSVTYENTSENPSPEPRNVRFQVTDDEAANSVPSNRTISVTPVNDAPVVTPSEGAGSYTEGDAPTDVDAAVGVGDVDDTSLEGAQVRISDGFEAGDDLVYVNQLGIDGVYNTGTGVLTLTGSASVADYETALRSIQFSGTSDNPPASKTVEYVVNDGDLDSLAATKEIAVTPVNDKPVLDSSDGTVAYTENDPPLVIDDGISASDVDSTEFAGATVTVSGNFDAGDVLVFEDQNGIDGAYDSESGVLTLTGTASIADYETALRSVAYASSSDNPSAATRTVSFQVDDGGATDNLSDAVTRDVSVTVVNDAPTVATSGGSTTYTEGGPGVPVDASVAVTDPDDTNIESAEVRISSGFEAGDDLFYVNQLGIDGVYNTGTGVLTLTGSATLADYEAALRSIEFRTTAEDPSATRTVDFEINDGDAASAVSSKSIDVVEPPPPNEAPVVTTSSGSASYTIGDAAVPVDPALTVTDATDTDLESAQVEIVGCEAGDGLSFEDQNGISGTFNPETCVLSLGGTSSVANYETALRSVAFSHADANDSPVRSISFKVNDGEADSALASRSVDIVTPPPPEP